MDEIGDDEYVCPFCGKTEASIDDAMAAGWTPNFWITETIAGGPCCEQCAALHLMGHDNEPIVKPGHWPPSGHA